MSASRSPPLRLDSPFEQPSALKGKGKAQGPRYISHDDDQDMIPYSSDEDEDRSPTPKPTQSAKAKGKSRDVSREPAVEPVGLGFSFVDDSAYAPPAPRDSLEIQRQSLEEIDDRQLALAMEISRLESEFMDYEALEGSSSTMSPELKQIKEVSTISAGPCRRIG